MKIIGVIPARYDSSRFPGKPLTIIGGRPMIYWVYHQAIKVKNFDEVYVATDSEKIEKICQQQGINVIMTSNAHQTGTDRLGEVAKKIHADYYVNIQGDEPLIEPEIIEQVVNRILSDPSVSVVNSMTLVNDVNDIQSFTCVKVVTNEQNKAIYLSRSPIPYPKRQQTVDYYKHLGLYALKKSALLWFAENPRGKIEQIEDIEMLRFLENGFEIDFVTVDSETIAVDRPEDVERVEAEMKRRGIRVDD